MPARTSTRKRVPNRRIRNSRSRKCRGNTLTQKGGGKKCHQFRSRRSKGGRPLFMRSNRQSDDTKTAYKKNVKRVDWGIQLPENTQLSDVPIYTPVRLLKKLPEQLQEAHKIRKAEETQSDRKKDKERKERKEHDKRMQSLRRRGIRVILDQSKIQDRVLNLSGFNLTRLKELSANLSVFLNAHGLTSLDVSNNNLGKFKVPFEYRDVWIGVIADYIEMKQRARGKPDVIALANSIKNNQTLTSLNIRANYIHGVEAGNALGEMLAENNVLKELDLSHQDESLQQRKLDAACAKGLAYGLSRNSQLESLNISGNSLTRGQFKPYVDSKGKQIVNVEEFWYLRKGQKDTEYETDMGGLDALIDAIEQHTKLVSVNIIGNSIDEEHATRLCTILENHPTLTSLCGNKGGEQELIMSGVCGGVAEGGVALSRRGDELDSQDYKMLLAEIDKNKTLTTLKIYGCEDPGGLEVVQIKNILERRGGNVEFFPDRTL